MQANRLFTIAALAAGLCVARAAHAQSSPCPEPPPSLWIGGSVGVSPVGSQTTQAPGGDSLGESEPAATSYQFAGLLDYHMTPNVSLGTEPAVIFRVGVPLEPTSGTEIDLPFRVAVGGNVSPSTQLYIFITPGYSILLPAASFQRSYLAGPMFGFGANLSVAIARKLAVTTELSYQFRFTSSSFDGGGDSLRYEYLTFSLGLARGID